MYNPYFASKRAKIQTLYNDFYFGVKASENRKKSEWSSDDGTVELILLKFREILFEFFVRPLPLDPLFKNKEKRKNLDLDIMEELLVENNPIDEIFMRAVSKS